MKLKEILSRKGLTAIDFAKKMGVTPSYIYYACSKDFNPTIKQAQKIADALEVSVMELLELESDQNTTVCPHCGGIIHITK